MTQVITYRLRASSPQPASNYAVTRYFVLQAFGAEQIDSNQCEDKQTLLQSDDMSGLGGAYQSASYRGKEFVTLGNVRVFDAEETLIPVFMNEEDVPGGVFLP